ncbi:hypothetical protein FCH28_18065 [Streptomyces piniterrae]|uniref:Uncharacterized protein n=1 Tax=Streptomyces piniterrae TaxID=2571125 RepID=A0A4U0NFX6_9ACTN|nr:hypothetical protein [Streptomyces piniterrae]TJZ53051.1 hypothetical protein FCH28_18065 [Streptomyces piniterrae]
MPPLSARAPRTAAYAAAVAVFPWVLGVLMMSLFSSTPDDWLSVSTLALPTAVFLALFAIRLIRRAEPRWMTVAIDTVAYTVILLADGIVQAAVTGDAAPVDAGFVQLIFGLLFTLTIPATLALSALLSKPLLRPGQS